VTADDLTALLPANSSFAKLSRDEMGELLTVGRIRKVNPGGQILAQGEIGDALFLIVSGTVRISMIASNGQVIVLDYIEAGGTIGEIGTLDGGLRTASAHALQHVIALRVSKADFEGYVTRHPRLALSMLAELARRLRTANDTIESDRAFTMGPRMARHLNRLIEQKADGRHLAAGLSQAELGSFVGLSRENVNRQLSNWADLGIIQLENGKVRVLDGASLKRIGATGG
jgi:CRP/FNR family cyclic AMP-dependent transcriptional regulator